MSVTRIHNDAVELRADNKRLREELVKMREVATSALTLLEQYKLLLRAVTDKINVLRGNANVDTRGSDKP
jgi:hypothetical protein